MNKNELNILKDIYQYMLEVIIQDLKILHAISWSITPVPSAEDAVTIELIMDEIVEDPVYELIFRAVSLDGHDITYYTLEKIAMSNYYVDVTIFRELLGHEKRCALEILHTMEVESSKTPWKKGMLSLRTQMMKYDFCDGSAPHPKEVLHRSSFMQLLKVADGDSDQN